MPFSLFCIHWHGKLRNLLKRAKNIYIYIAQVTVAQWQSCRLQIQRLLVHLPPVFFCLPSHGAPSVKLRILQNFTLYLRNSWSLNLRAIENCICGLRSIERKMRSILRARIICLGPGTSSRKCSMTPIYFAGSLDRSSEVNGSHGAFPATWARPASRMHFHEAYYSCS